MKKSTSSVAVVSLFSGCGGLDAGAHLAGARTVAAIDFDADSVKSLGLNVIFRGADLRCADISTFDSKEFKRKIRLEKPGATIIIGGPPCQPFSKNGYWVTNKKRLGIRDPRNLIGQYFRMVEEIGPDGFILENVESMLHPTNLPAVREIEASIAELGYQHILVRANALDYGVPQKRKRVFFIASRRRLLGAPRISHRSAEELPLLGGAEPHPGVKEFIREFAGKKFFEPQEDATKGTYYPELKQVPPGKNYLVLSAKDGSGRFVTGKRFWNFLLKLHPDEPSWTISAQPGPWVGPFHWENRRLRVPEIAAIQTFPRGYKFYGSRRSIQRQIGNAVPSLMAKAMVEYLIKQL